MNNLPLEILDTAKEFVINLMPTLEEVSKDYYTYQYGPCPYLNGFVTLYPVKVEENNTPYARAERFLNEVSLNNLVEIRLDIERNSFEHSLETNLFILYRNINAEVVTYSIPLDFLTKPLQRVIDEFKKDTKKKQESLKEELKALSKKHKEQQKVINNLEYQEYLQLKKKYGGKDGNRIR